MVQKYFTVCLVLTIVWGPAVSSVSGQVQNRPARASSGGRGISNTDLAYLVTNDAVVKELAISAEAYDKLVRATESLRAELRLATEDAAGLEKGTPEYAEGRRKLAKATESAQDAFLVKVQEILTPEQFTRVQQITYHAKGVEAFDDPMVAELLALSQEQHQRIARIKTESSKKMQSVASEGNGNGREIIAKLQELRKENATQIVGVLNPDQLAIWTKLKGKDFDLTRTRGGIVGRPGNGEVRGASPASNSELESISRIGPPYNHGNRDVLSLVVNEEVAKELGLSDEAAGKLKKLALDRNVEIREAAGDIVRPGVDRLSPDQVKTLGERSKVICNTYVPKVKEILSADQYVRAQQICWQASGNGVYHDPDMIHALGLTKEQQDKITTLVKESRERSFAFIRSGSGYEQGTEVSRLREQLAEVLTTEQTAKLKVLKGEPFDLSKILRFRTRPGRLGTDAPPVDLSRVLSAQPDVLAMAANRGVVQELGLSDETAAKLKTLLDAKNAEIKTATDAKNAELESAESNTRRPRGEQYFSEQQKQIEEVGKTVRAAYVPKLKEVLTAEQFTRLQQITWQLSGVTALIHPEVVQLLGLTQEQQDKIVSLLKESSAKLRSIIDDPGQNANERHAESEAIRKQIPTVLTAEQAAKWETLKGIPFDRSKLSGRKRTERPDDVNRRTIP